jgi:hypothetical protein
MQLASMQVTERRPGDHAQRTTKRFSTMIRKSTFAATFAKLAGTAAVAATLCMSSSAQAGVLDFETPVDSPFVFSGDVITMGNYYVEAAGDAGFTGAIANTDSCMLQCPVNGTTNYYTALNDGYMYFGLNSGAGFTISSLDASFLGNGGTYPSIAGLLYIAAFDAAGLVAETYLNLAGPTGGSFNLATYDLSGFGGGSLFTDVLVASYACDANGNCNRTTNQAQFAIDNIVTVDAITGDVPEPGSFALMGLGMFGIGAIARRRKAAVAAI